MLVVLPLLLVSGGVGSGSIAADFGPLGKPKPTPTPNATPTPTAFAQSYYVIQADLNTTVFYNEGCAFGTSQFQPNNGWVILDFGQPWNQSGTEGTILRQESGLFLLPKSLHW